MALGNYHNTPPKALTLQTALGRHVLQKHPQLLVVEPGGQARNERLRFLRGLRTQVGDGSRLELVELLLREHGADGLDGHTVLELGEADAVVQGLGESLVQLLLLLLVLVGLLAVHEQLVHLRDQECLRVLELFGKLKVSSIFFLRASHDYDKLQVFY